MSLKKKIIIGFLVSFSLIALLAVFLLVNFVEIKKETTFLELTDTIRSKSLQLRRHEKNYFLYAPSKTTDETKAIYGYLDELDKIADNMGTDRVPQSASLKNLVREYHEQFSKIEMLVNNVSEESSRLGKSFTSYSKISRLIESNFLDRPLEDVEYLKKEFSFRSDHQLISWLKELDVEINALRKTGENLLAFSKELDRTARNNVDNFISMARTAIILLLPLFFIVGAYAFLLIIGGVVKRLQLLTNIIEKTGEGNFSQIPVSSDKFIEYDEVGTLIQKFNTMEEQLSQREKELLQSKKLAAIGTLASGVAHELNNPLNNIYTTAQRLTKKTGDDIPPFVKKGLDDIFTQAIRVKGIVADLLEFARGREPHFIPIELRNHISNTYKHLSNTVDTQKVDFLLETHPEEIFVHADPEQLEQVFINLFTNAVDAMSGKGKLSVKAEEGDNFITIKVSDSGKGISRTALDKIFEPFYTTKDKGTGLGLAIVFNIILKHDGKITVESKEAEGTTFTITLQRGTR